MDTAAEDLLRELAPQVLGALVRRYGHFDLCEDAVQEALLAASQQWPAEGLPDNPRAWLIRVASRRLTDQLRSEEARRRREETVAALDPADIAPAADDEQPPDDDTLTLLFMCCHPELSPPSQVALTLRAVGGLTTAQIASAFLVPEATMAQRISRAKQRIKASGATFQLPPDAERTDRLRVVLQVLYLIFNEGYTATSGPQLQHVELATEAIRLARAVRKLLPGDGEVAGLLALMLLTHARRSARARADGTLVPLAEQDRTLWDAEAIAEGVRLITETLARSPVETDWPQILGLYRILERLAPNPMVTLNHAVALAMVEGPQAGLDLLAVLDADNRVAEHHRLEAVRAHLYEMAGDYASARSSYRAAARRTTSLPEQRYLESRAARLPA